MSISCGCGEHDWYYTAPDDFVPLVTRRRRRCVSCGELIDIGADCLVFPCYRQPASLVEERIHGDEVPMADRHMCASCGEIFLNLTAYGYCVTLGGDMRDDLKTHQENTGFDPEKYRDDPTPPLTTGDWVAQSGCFGKQFGKVVGTYDDGFADIVVYSLDGRKKGRTSPAAGGPRGYEPYCDPSGWTKLACGKPDFPVTPEEFLDIVRR